MSIASLKPDRAQLNALMSGNGVTARLVHGTAGSGGIWVPRLATTVGIPPLSDHKRIVAT